MQAVVDGSNASQQSASVLIEAQLKAPEFDLKTVRVDMGELWMSLACDTA